MLKFFFILVGSGIRDGRKFRIRDKHPGPATLVTTSLSVFHQCNGRWHCEILLFLKLGLTKNNPFKLSLSNLSLSNPSLSNPSLSNPKILWSNQRSCNPSLWALQSAPSNPPPPPVPRLVLWKGGGGRLLWFRFAQWFSPEIPRRFRPEMQKLLCVLGTWFTNDADFSHRRGGVARQEKSVGFSQF